MVKHFKERKTDRHTYREREENCVFSVSIDRIISRVNIHTSCNNNLLFASHNRVDPLIILKKEEGGSKNHWLK